MRYPGGRVCVFVRFPGGNGLAHLFNLGVGPLWFSSGLFLLFGLFFRGWHNESVFAKIRIIQNTTNPGRQSSGNLYTRKDMPQQAIAMVNQMPLSNTNPIVGNNKNWSLSLYIAIIFASVSGLLKYTRGRLCQRGIRLFRTRVAGPTNPITRNANNRGISNRLIVRFRLPLLQTFLYLFQRPTIRVGFTEMQESIPAQFPVNR